MNRIILSLLAVIVLLLTAVSGCIFPEEKKEEGTQEYILEAVINTDKSVIYPNEIVTFDASSSKGDILEYYWDFNVSGEINWEVNDSVVAHSYNDCGAYKIALKVVDKNDYKTNYTFVYVNYYNEINDNITVGNQMDHYFPVKGSAKKATVTLTYSPGEAPITKNQTENLDLSVKAKYNNTYEYVKSSNNTNDNGEETVAITHADIQFHESGDWIAEVDFKYKHPLYGASEIAYSLKIEVHYEL